jgi:UDP:flavonoid glycosyltransferase YjiC (YdhE family)
MATVLLTWELGGGIGHLRNLRPIGEELIRRGHRVFAVVRDLAKVRSVLGEIGIPYVPAPIVVRHGPAPFDPPTSFAHVLANIGFANESSLATVFEAWNTLFDVVRPDLVVADHSPSALLALWGRAIKRINVGIGFFCPPPSYPLPAWSRDGQISRKRMATDEEAVRCAVNTVLQAHHRPVLARLSQLFNEIDEVFLATYRELDHFGPRENTRYWGHWPFGPGIEPIWPAGRGPKIYAYFKPFAALEAVLSELVKLQAPTIMLAGDIDMGIQKKYACSTLRFEQQPLDLREAAAQCDVALLNANHGTATAMFLAGKPCLLIPLFLEQALFAQKVESLGAGRLAPPTHAAATIAGLREVLSSGQLRAGAQRFARSYSWLKPGEQVGEIVDHLENILRRE